MLVNKINKIILESDQRVQVVTSYFLGIPILQSKATITSDSVEEFRTSKFYCFGIPYKKSIVIRDLNRYNPKFSRFGHKWYVDYTLRPVMIPDDWDRHHFDFMQSHGFVFDSKEEAEKVAQKIKTLLGIQSIL